MGAGAERPGLRRRLRPWVVGGALLLGTEVRAEGVLARVVAREQTLAQFADKAEQVARQQARAAYRLARRRQLGFMALPEARLDDARALDLALFTVRRSAGEARVIRDELERVRDERQALSAAAGRTEAASTKDEVRFVKPVRGSVVGEPGLRRDEGTGIEVRHQALQILARMNELVRAPADGTVKRIEAQPQGGFTVVMTHGGDWVSVLSGLREVSSAVGATVEGGEPLGLAGRNLDGAVVVSIELWRGRTPVDPGRLLHRRRK